MKKIKPFRGLINRSLKKTLLVMRLICIFLILGILHVQASDSYSQKTKLSISFTDTKLIDVLYEIEEESEFYFLYNEKLLDTERKVSISENNQTLDAILDHLFADTDVRYSIIDRKIILVPESLVGEKEKQQLIITGTILDASNGEPLPGVNVQIKGTLVGSVTDIEGKYSLNVSDNNASLVFSYIGYKTQEISLNGRTKVDISLENETVLLDEVVVIGYGTQKKVNLTGAVGYVDSEVLKDRPITSIGQGLQGVIPNLNITQSTGSLGLAPSFNIRGNTSITGGSPLILVNGIPMDINLVNPSDIESISVLKDAASAAIYGARAAYGVILVTTKGGMKKGKPTVSLSANYAINSPIVFLDHMDSKERLIYMNIASQSETGRDYYDEYLQQAILEHYEDPSTPEVFWNPLRSSNVYYIYDYCANTNWPKEMFRKSYPMQQYNISVSGGSDNFNYYTSYGYMNQEGISRHFDEKYTRNNFMMNLNYNVLKWLSIGTKASVNTSKKHYPPTDKTNSFIVNEENLNFHYAIWPTFPAYGFDGVWLDFDGVSNPIQAQKEGGYRDRDIDDIWITGLVKLTPIKHMSFNVDYSVNARKREDLSYIRQQPYYDRDRKVAGYYWASIPNGVTRMNYNNHYYALNAYADYENTFFNKHYVKAVIGFNQENANYKTLAAERKGLIIDQIPYMRLATGEMAAWDAESEYAIRGAFGRVNYSFSERYLVEFDFRYDGTSKFPTKDRFAFFPSASIGWRIDNEAFFSDLKNTINLLKFRVSYGNLGNQAISDYYPYISTYSTGQAYYTFGGERPVTTYAPGLVSATLTWEKVTQSNFGLDFALFNSKLSGSFDYYNRTTKDMLTNSEKLPSVLAVSEPRTNGADLKTTGFDLTLGWKHKVGSVGYGFTFLLSDYTSEITKYSNPSGIISDYYVGRKMGEIWGFETGGLFQSDEEALALDQTAISGRDRKAGDLYFVDLNDDDKIDYGDGTLSNPGDRKIIGNSTPRYSYGFKANGSWKGFDLDIFFQGIGKRDIIISDRYFLSQYLDEWCLYPKIGTDYWTTENRDAYFPRPLLSGGADIIEPQTRFMQNAAYLRLKEVTLGYTIPVSFSQKAFIERFRIYFSGANLLTWTKMIKINDPELQGVNTYPLNRSVSFGLNIDF